MGRVKFQDTTIRQMASEGGSGMLFKEKIETAKILDKLGADVISLPAFDGKRSSFLLVKAVAMDAKRASVSVPIGTDAALLEGLWPALKEAARPRLAVECMSSNVGMEYVQGKKGEALVKAVSDALKACRGLTADVELSCLDASRADESFLARLIGEAIASGANVVTLHDSAGLMLPDEVGGRIRSLRSRLGGRDGGVIYCASFGDGLGLATALSYYAVRNGFGEIAASCVRRADSAYLPEIARLLCSRSANPSDAVGLDVRNITAAVSRISRMAASSDLPAKDEDGWARHGDGDSYGDDDAREDGIALTQDETRQSVFELAQRLGYDLSNEDLDRVYDAFSRNVRNKKSLGRKEFESIIATEAMQVPATYALKDYVYASDRASRAMSHITLERSGGELEGVAVGDGPIDASFLAIGKIVGQQCELDDFSIRSITEGQEALGETLVKLRRDGKLYSGCGISTDIVASTVKAYLAALNKMIWEEENERR